MMLRNYLGKMFVCAAACLLVPSLRAVDGIYLGGEIGNVGLSGNLGTSYNNAIGFGADLGLEVNPLVDTTLRFQHSSHSGGINGLSLNTLTLSADVHALQINDFDFILGLGPGFYFLSDIGFSQSNFGLNFGAGGGVKVDENIRVGLDFRYHVLMGSNTSNIWTVMARAGYLFEMQ